MNVLLVPSSYVPNVGGVEEVTRGLAEELRRAGHGVGVATSLWPDSLSAREAIDDVEVRRFAFEMPARRTTNFFRFLFGHRRTLRAISRFANDISADLIHIHCLGPNTLYATWAAMKLRIPLVLTTHGELQDVDQAHSPAIRCVRSWALNRADWVTACSKFTLDGAMVPKTVRSCVVYNGRRSEEKVDDGEEQTERFGFCAARLTRNKGVDLAINAFALAAPGVPDLKLYIAGDGPERGSLEELTVRLGLSDRICFLGFQPIRVVHQLMHRCLFFICPSRNEGFGMVNLEAMAAGKAVVATRVGGVPEIVTDGVNGMVVPSENVGALASAIGHMAANAALRERLGQAGLERAARFTWRAIADQYIAVYEQVCRARWPRRA